MIARLRKQETSFAEFVIIMSLMISLVALSIDAMLPALPEISNQLGVQNDNDRQLIISVLFLGLSVGQLFFGPLSDTIGRKPTIYIGYVLYILGSLMAVFAGSFQIMLYGRLLQGIGVSAPRSITLAIVRDKYEGRIMARVMSFVMTVFILVPILAPSMGQGIMLFTGWRGIFVAFIVIALISLAWFALRVPETLTDEKRAPFSINRILTATLVIVRNKIALGYTISAGLIGGAFVGYLNSSQQIFAEQYALGELFPIIFAIVAIALGLASFSNTRLVMRYGMRFLVDWSLRIIVILAAIGLAVAYIYNGNPPFIFLMTYLMTSFFCIGILFGNQNTLAMEPLGKIAGIGAAIVGSLSTFIQMFIGTYIGQQYNGTVFPLIIGIATAAILCIFVTAWAESGNNP